MRTLLAWTFVLGIAAVIGAAQQGEKRARRRFEPPSVIAAAEAVYPLQSVASGTVVLEISLDDAAKITDIRVVRGIASLTEPAERSVRQWTFQAAKLDGKPVPSKIVVAFSFVPPNIGPRVVAAPFHRLAGGSLLHDTGRGAGVRTSDAQQKTMREDGAGNKLL